MQNNYLESITKQFEYYKMLGDKTIEQLSEDQMFWQYNPESNSIAIIIKHLSGNMLSRWTDFLSSDGEKDWRNRESEFANSSISKELLLEQWNEGWNCLLASIKSLSNLDLQTEVFIRNQGHTVTEAINRQLAHYAYHIGQIVFIGKMLKVHQWNSLSIPKGSSEIYNADKFAKPKAKAHFTDDYLKDIR